LLITFFDNFAPALEKMKKLKEFYGKYKSYFMNDLIMYVLLIVFILILFIFF